MTMKFDELLEACHARLQLHVAFDSHGCSYSGKDPIALAVIELLGEAFPCMVPPPVSGKGKVFIDDGGGNFENPNPPVFEFTPSEAHAYAAALLRCADEAEAKDA